MHQQDSRPRFVGLDWGKVVAFIVFTLVTAITLWAAGTETGSDEGRSAGRQSSSTAG